MIIGDKGTMIGHRLIPETKMREFGKPPRTLPRSPGHHREWLDACKGGPAPGSNFPDHAAPLAEVLKLTPRELEQRVVPFLKLAGG